MTQPILARIRVIDKDGNEIGDTTDKDMVENWGIGADPEWRNIVRLNIGTIIPRDDGRKLKVVNISSNMYDQTDKIDLNIGVNTCVYGETYPFNFEIIYEVELVAK